MATQQSMKTYFTTEPLETYYITEDKPLLIDCAVVSADIFTWRCNSKRMEKERQTVIQGLDSAGNRNIQSQLKITYSDVQVFHAEVGDSSTYQCICIAWFQDSSTPGGWGRLDSQPEFGFVKLAYLNSTFRNEPSDIIANLNTDVTLACEPPRGQPDPAVYWHKDGKRLDSHRIYTMNSLGHLTIHKVQQNDEGTYTCIAVNAAKAAQSRSASLTINSDLAASTTTSLPSIDFPEVIPSTPVFFIDFQSEYTLEKDGTKAMVCAVMSAEQMTIECGGKRLATEEYDLQSKVHRDSGKRLLVVKTVVTAEKVAKMPDDYFCQCTAWFLNEQRAWKNLLSSKGYVRSTARSVYIRDQFQIIPVDVYANFQAEERIECNPPEGYPSPTVYWLKDGTRIYSDQDPNFVILTEGTLVIEYVRVIDEGKYVCVAENEAGIRSSHPVQLTVIGKPEQTIATTEMIKPDITTHTPEDTTTIDPYITTLTEPVFSEELNKEYYIIKGQPVTLECTVIAAKQLLFVCNGEVLTETSLTDVNYLYPENQFYSRKNSLVVTKVEVEKHTGSKPYTCACRAYYHKKDDDPPQLKYVDSSPAVIQVPYMSNHFEQEPSDTEVTYLGRAELSCKAPNGAPQPEVNWLKNGFRILQSERIKIESSGNLVINKFYAEDVGAYTCVAENFVRSRPSRTANVSLADEKVTKSDNEPNTVQPEPETTVTGIDSSVYYPSAPYISKDLQEVYYLIDNKPTIISCEAYDVELITFICGMQTVEDPEVKARAETVVLQNGSIQIVKVTEALVQVSKKEVENYSPGNEYWCQCHANFRVIDSEVYQQISSIKGVVKIADHEGSTCGQMLADCDKLFLFGNDLDLCAAFPEYTTCMDDFINKCAGIVDENTMRNANMTYIDTQRKCFLEPKCPELENCKRVPSNSPSSGLTVQNFCSDGSNLVQCIDSALAACNVRLTPTEEKLKESLFAVVNWFTNFCKRMILGSESLTSCEKMKTCDTYIGQLAADNATSWCRLMSSLVECTNDAVNVCQMDELRNDLEHLHSEARYIYCSKDDYEETNGYLEPVITPVEPSRESKQEGDAEPKSESELAPNGDNNVSSVETNENKDSNKNSGERKSESIEKGSAGKQKTDFDDGHNNSLIDVNNKKHKFNKAYGKVEDRDKVDVLVNEGEDKYDVSLTDDKDKLDVKVTENEDTLDVSVNEGENKLDVSFTEDEKKSDVLFTKDEDKDKFDTSDNEEKMWTIPKIGDEYEIMTDKYEEKLNISMNKDEDKSDILFTEDKDRHDVSDNEYRFDISENEEEIRNFPKNGDKYEILIDEDESIQIKDITDNIIKTNVGLITDNEKTIATNEKDDGNHGDVYKNQLEDFEVRDNNNKEEDQKEFKTSAEAAKDNNGSTMLCTSVLLTAISQLLIMIIQPLR